MTDTEERLLAAFRSAPSHRDCLSLLTASMQAAVPGGLVLEFGVYSGRTLTHLASQTTDVVYGFDSFRGLPESWNGDNPVGKFDAGGEPPVGLPANTRVVVGMFGDTLAGFLASHPGHVSLVHIDCDLYSSTRTVLRSLAERCIADTVVNFNEFWGYPEASEHEFRAFAEFLDDFGWDVEGVGRAGSTYCQAAFRLR